jgi:hypothetical protein
MGMRKEKAVWLLWAIVLGHFMITLVHGAAHAGARVPMSAAANVFIAVVIEIGPLAGLLLSRSRPAAGGWIVAAGMAGALVFGVVNHFLVDGADHVAHIADEWRVLFAVTATLLALTEIAGTAAGIVYARLGGRTL